MHHLILQYTCLLAIILFVVMVAQKIKIAYPILLVLVGLPLGFVPFLNGIQIEPELIFVIFLPPLLFESAWNTSWKDFWKWRRVISSFAVIIVIITSCLVAVVSHSLIPGFTFAAGFLLGGIISPPDAVSASQILKNLTVPKRLVSIVEGESLLNDASGLVVFRFALASIITGKFVFHEAAISFVLVIVMGIAIGLAIALVFYAIHRWLPTTANMDIVLTFIAPYAMYMAAENFHYSGVLAVVSGGLFLSAQREYIFSHRSRLKGLNVWEAVAFVLNGFVFMLIGLEFPVVVRALGPGGLVPAVKYSLIITAVLIVGRIACTFGASAFTMFISRYIRTADSRPGWKLPLVFGWAGMRGVVSLAAALSIPVALRSGGAFPNRNLILFITFSVILLTLVVQGLTLPLIIKWLDLPDPDYTISLDHQRLMVRKKMAHIALKTIEDKYGRHVENNDMIRAFQIKLKADLELLKDWEQDDVVERSKAYYADFRAMMENIMREQRTLLHTLNKKDGISDHVVKAQMELIDLEEEKLRQHFADGEN